MRRETVTLAFSQAQCQECFDVDCACDFRKPPAPVSLHRYISEEERITRWVAGSESWPRHLCEPNPGETKNATGNLS